MELNPYESPPGTIAQASYRKIALRVVSVAIMIPSVLTLGIATFLLFSDYEFGGWVMVLFVMLPAIGGLLISLAAWRQQVGLLLIGIALTLPMVLLQCFL